MRRLNILIKILSKVRIRWTMPESTVLLVDETSYQLESLIEERISRTYLPLRNPIFIVTPKILFQFIYQGLRTPKNQSFHGRYVYALSKAINCNLIY